MTSFRPRPIDIDKPLFIVREELNEEETRSIPALATGMEQHEENESHIRQAIIEAQQNNTRLVANIPTPIVREVSYYDEISQDNWERPYSYIKVTPPVNPLFCDHLTGSVDYDLDKEDSFWLQELNKNSQILSEEEFEIIIDIFEKTLARERFLLQGISKETNFTIENAKEAVDEMKRGYHPQLIESIYNYWMNKRSRFNNRSLIVSLSLPPQPDDPSPLVAFRPREKETKKRARSTNQYVLVRLKKLRLELQRGRSLLEMIKQREELKRKRLEIQKQMIEIRFIQKSRMADHEIESTENKKSGNNVKEKVFSLEESSGGESDEEYSDEEGERSASEWDHFPPHQHNREYNKENGKYWGRITLPNLPAFRGRVRIGRGGRVIIDRAPIEPKSHTILWY